MIDFVSVIIPFYSKGNRLHLLEACRSIAEQNYEWFELLVIVNGPDAATVHDELAPLLEDYDVRLLLSEPAGIAHALNLGIELAKGQFIARMDADDIAHPNRLTQQVKWMRNNQLDVCSSAMTFIRDNKIQEGVAYWQPIHDWSIRLSLHFFCALAHPTVMFRREIVTRVDRYAQIPFSEDYDLWLRLKRLPSIRFGAYPGSLLYYRLHPNQQTSSSNTAKITQLDRSLKLREFQETWNPLFLLGTLPFSGLVRRIAGRRIIS